MIWLVAAAWPAVASAAPVLRSADVAITIESSRACTVVMTLDIDEADRIDHRLALPGQAQVDQVAIAGATEIEPPRDVGRTRSLVLRPDRPIYELRYRVMHDPSFDGRCPLWVPAVPADGVTRNVRLLVELPAGAVAGGSMPALAWSGRAGTATLGHLPAFVRLQIGYDGQPPGWDLAIVMDGLTLAAFAVGTAVWLWRRRRR